MATTITDGAGSDPIEEWLTNGAEKVRITSGGSVGIGTTAPNDTLEVKGIARITGNAGSPNYLRTDNSANAGGKVWRIGDTGALAAGNFSVYNETNAIAPLAILSGGNVGIGTTSPAALLHVKCDGSSTDQLRLENSHSGGKVWQISDGIDSVNGDLSIRDQTDSITIAAFHFVTGGIFGSEKVRCLRIGDPSGTQIRFDTLVLGQEQNYAGATRAGNALLIRLDNGGPFVAFNTLFRNTANTGNFTGGTIGINKVPTSDASFVTIITNNGGTLNQNFYMDQNGNVGLGGTTTPDMSLSVTGNADKSVGGMTWATFSDIRLKDVHGLYDAGLRQILALQPIRFRYKKDSALGLRDEDEEIGFSAQEVQKVIPEAVSVRKDGYLRLHGDPILWAMLNAIKEQQEEIRKLQTQMKELQNVSA